MGNGTIRKGVPDDFEAIWVINAEGQPGVSAFSHIELTALLATPDHVWVAVDDESYLTGYCATYRSDEAYDGEEFAWFQRHYPAFLYIDQIAIAARNRRSGVGAQLYVAIEQAALGMRFPALACEVNRVPPNPNSLAFHTRIGFAEVGALDTSDGRSVALLLKPMSACT